MGQHRTEIFNLITRDFAKYSRERFIFKNVKICGCCEKMHGSVSRDKARFWKEADAYVFECSCNSTLMVDIYNIAN